MMERIESSSTSSSCVPPGFRFHPTDEELVGYYLRKKIASQKIDLDVIKDIDLYRIEPWDLQEKCRIGYEEEKEWYFFSHKDKKYPTGTRTNRATLAGFWKATGRDKAVYDNKTTKLIGMRKTLVFYKGRAPNGLKSDWIIHEYRLESQENAPPQEEGWVVCRAFKKRLSAQAKNNEAWDASNFYDEPTHIITRHQNLKFSRNDLTCKQEFYESENFNNFMTDNSDPIFFQLPQLDSPSLLSLPKSQSSKSLISSYNEFEAAQAEIIKNKNKNKNVTHDWRDLDKFVAYQLSQGVDNAVISSFVDDSDFGFLNNKDDFFSSDAADCDIGIRVFDK